MPDQRKWAPVSCGCLGRLDHELVVAPPVPVHRHMGSTNQQAPVCATAP